MGPQQGVQHVAVGDEERPHSSLQADPQRGVICTKTPPKMHPIMRRRWVFPIPVRPTNSIFNWQSSGSFIFFSAATGLDAIH